MTRDSKLLDIRVIGALIVGILIGATTLVLADALSGSEVRVGARVLEDGRTEIVVQEQGEGGWTTHAPERRFLSADATPDRWYFSENVQLAAPQEAAPGAESAATADADGAFTCVVTHGSLDDSFWVLSGTVVNRVRAQYGLDLRLFREADSADQAAAIRNCVDDGARIIMSSIPDPDVVGPALKEAAEAGVYVATFNSGGDRANEFGSWFHVAIDEQQAGRLAAAEFSAQGVSGDIVCIIHEATNIGLDQRCDGLEEAYDGGDVIRVNIASAANPVAALTTALSGDIGAVLTLNSDTGVEVANNLAAAGSDIPVGTAGLNLESLIVSGVPDNLLFFIYDYPSIQTAVGVLMADFDFATAQRIVGTPAENLDFFRQIVVQPRLVSVEEVGSVVETYQQIRARRGN